MPTIETKGEVLKGDSKVLDPSLFPDNKRKIVEMIERIRNHPGHGQPYKGSSEKAGRHPIKPDTTAILAREVKARKPKHIVEMGTAYGFSTLYLGFGQPDAKITTYEFDPEVAEEAQGYLDEAGLNAEVVPGKVEDHVDVLADGRPLVGVLFMDHNKGSYLADFQAVEPCLSPDAVILADNVNDRRDECQDFVDYMFENYGAEIIPTQAGLLVAEVQS